MKSQTLPFRKKGKKTVQMLFVLFILSLAVGPSANLTVTGEPSEAQTKDANRSIILMIQEGEGDPIQGTLYEILRDL